MPLLVPGGRVYVFYTYNGDNLRAVPSGNSAKTNLRVDTLGHYCFKYSDDNGRTWSRERFEIPMRKMRIDRENNTRGETLFFWGVGKPITVGKSALFGFAKVGKWGSPGTMVMSQGVFMRSDNILAEPDPAEIRWELLPDGDLGLRAPKGPVSDEANPAALSDGSLYATYRTIDGYPCHAYSRDGGHTWTAPAYAVYTPSGRRIKHPRAANFVRKFSNGKFLYWFHNHGGEPVHAGPWNPYMGRNPAWVCGGVEKRRLRSTGRSPRVLLYDDDPETRMSYPDFIEDGGRYLRHRDPEDGRAGARDRPDPARGALDAGRGAGASPATGSILDDGRRTDRGGLTRRWCPSLADLRTRRGFTIDLRVRFDELTAGQTILDTRDQSGKGILLATSERSTLRLTLSDGRTRGHLGQRPGHRPRARSRWATGSTSPSSSTAARGSSRSSSTASSTTGGRSANTAGAGSLPTWATSMDETGPRSRPTCWGGWARSGSTTAPCASRKPSATVATDSTSEAILRRAVSPLLLAILSPLGPRGRLPASGDLRTPEWRDAAGLFIGSGAARRAA